MHVLSRHGCALVANRYYYEDAAGVNEGSADHDEKGSIKFHGVKVADVDG